ncbi:MAG: hypothetical protein JWR40_85 [Massilia sp.]|nr:hypothetical protein [Massilia sp.]
MFGSGVLDIVIGVVFVFLLVSLLVTTCNELIASLFRSRAKWLEYGVDRLIGSPWARQLYGHPLIEGSATNWKPADPGKRPWFGSGPSYIPSRAFANILMELLHGADNALRQTEAALQKTLELASVGATSVADITGAVDEMATSLPAIIPARVAAAIRTDLQRLSAILDRNDAGRLVGWLGELEGHTRAITDPALVAVKTALAGLVADAKNGDLGIAHIRQATLDAMNALPAGSAGAMARADLNLVLTRLDAGYSVADAAADVRRFIRGIPSGYVRHLIEDLDDQKMRKALLTLFDDAGNDVEKFKQNIEVWFNSAMDRVGGWYKRRSQWVTGVISLVVVVAMNVDAMLIVRYLDAHPGVRDGLVTQAKAYADARAKDPAGAARPGVVAGDTVPGTLAITFSKPQENDVEVVFSTDAKGAVFHPKSVLLTKGATSADYTLDTAISDRAQKATVTATIPDAVVTPVLLDIQPSYPEQLKRIQQQLTDLKLPIGWVSNPPQADKDMYLGLPKLDWENKGEVWDALTYHLLGWLITAVAATLGAPFWFDMLNKIMSIRSAGRAPEEMPKSPEVVQAPIGPGQSARQANENAALARSGTR